MQTFSGGSVNAPLATGEGVVTGSAHVQGHEATMAFPAMDKTGQINSAASVQGDAQAAIENLSSGLASQIRPTAIDITENDAKRPG